MAKRRPRTPSTFNGYDRDFEREFEEYASADSSAKQRKSTKSVIFNATTLAILAGVFILGIGIGMGFSSVSGVSNNTGSKIVTQSELDSKAPNADLCVQFGASAIVTDMRVFVTLNPLNFYVSQATSRPGCVLRSNNWSILEQRGLVKPEQVRDCKQRMNTFGFTGDLSNNPEINCVYQNNTTQNLFLDQNGPNGRPIAEPDNERF
ncbi:Protein of unknown function (DUF3172) [Leptolyngbyaceae cyanobacterium JSC-12]|nr:Protein of unknown function (DUF3172) [Leptolyngbyaceae cyanobacterium JSC-12]